MIDFVMSENSMGFHAPQEATRILGDAINLCRLGQLSCTVDRSPATIRRTSRMCRHRPGRRRRPLSSRA